MKRYLHGNLMSTARAMALVVVWVAHAATAAQPAQSGGTVAVDERPSTAVGADYVVGPGDGLRITVLDNADLGAEVTVRPDGKISTPLANDVVAVGRTPSQLAAEIEERLRRSVRLPTVSIIVTKANGTFSQIKVIGQAVSPKALPYRSGLKVLDVLIDVGGLSQFASGNRAKIVRQVGSRSVSIPLRLRDLMEKGDVSQDLSLQPGDIIVIPEARL